MIPSLEAFAPATIFCVIPELLVIPRPLIVRFTPPEVIVYGLAPELKIIPFTSVLAERERAVVALAANVAVSDGPLGTVAGVQLPAVFQSPVAGLDLHWALPAWPGWVVRSNIKAGKSATLKAERLRRGHAPGMDVFCFWIILFCLGTTDFTKSRGKAPTTFCYIWLHEIRGDQPAGGRSPGYHFEFLASSRGFFFA